MIQMKLGILATAFVILLGTGFVAPASVWGLCWDWVEDCGNDMEYDDHDKCNKAWRSSKAASEQGCKLHTINADGTRGGELLCFHDVYCDRGEWWQRAEQKGRIYVPALQDLRRCANNPRKLGLSHQCEPITDDELRADAARYE